MVLPRCEPDTEDHREREFGDVASGLPWTRRLLGHQGGSQHALQVARLEFDTAGIAVSVVYPSVTATEFHQKLRPAAWRPGLGRSSRTLRSW